MSFIIAIITRGARNKKREMKCFVENLGVIFLDLTMALSNPIKFFNAHDKKLLKNQEANAEVSPTNSIYLFIYLLT